MPYAIELIASGDIVRRFSDLPQAFDLPDGRRIVSPVSVGDEGLGYRMVQIVEIDFQRPGTYYTQGEDVTTREASVITITRAWVAWTQQEIDAYEESRLDTIAAQIDAVDDVVRAAVLVIMDELNLHSGRLGEILGAAAAASSLANFKTLMGQVNAIPQRNGAQLKQAIRNKLGVAE